MSNSVETLKQELSAVELDQRFEMVQTVSPEVVDIENFICSPKEKAPEAPAAEQ